MALDRIRPGNVSRILLLVILLLGLGRGASPARAATLCVAPGGAGGCYASIQAAINAAVTGDTVTVAAGTYVESVVIDRSITLQGAGATSIIQPAGGPAIALRSPAALPPPLANVTIDGFTLRGSDGVLIDRNWWGGVEALTLQDLAILNVTASGNTVNGLTIRNGAVVNGLTINNSHFDANSQNGIAVSNATTQVNNVTIANTTISNNNQLGVYLLGPAMNGLNLAGVTVSNNGWEGMVIDNGAIITSVNINGSAFSSNGRLSAGRGNGIGIAMPATQITGLAINTTTFASNRNIGLYINRGTIGNFAMTSSTITGSTFDGIHITGNASLQTFMIMGGSISNNGGFGMVTRSGTGGVPVFSALTVEGVSFSGNNSSGLTLVATLNGTNRVRNNVFYNSGWEDFDIGVGWLGAPTTIAGTLQVAGNIFQMPAAGRAWASAYIDGTTTGVANISFTQNCFNNTIWGLGNNATGIVSAQNNWWNAATGPNTPGASQAWGANTFPWSTSAAICSAPVVLYGAQTIPVNGSVLSFGPTQVMVEYSKDVLGDGSAGAANTTSNYLLVEAGGDGGFNTVSCSSGLVADDVRIAVNSAVYSNNGGAGPYVATLTVNGGVNLPAGYYRLFVCGTTSVQDAIGNRLNGGAADSLLTFRVLAQALPATGFAPGRVTELPAQPERLAYAGLGDLWLEIPRLGVQMPIVGVPAADGDWNVAWLGDQAGWLEGSAFPAAAGNSVLTGHVWDAYNAPGPFADISALRWGDEVIVHSYGTAYVYSVRTLRTIAPNNLTAAFRHEDSAWLTLLTCKSFNEQSGEYDNRLIVRAQLAGTR